MQLYGSAWARAKRKGQGIGSVLGYLRARAEDKRQAVARSIARPPTTYEKRIAQELSETPDPKGQQAMVNTNASVKTADLKKALVAVCRSVERRSAIPILSHVKLEATSLGLRLTATDLEVSRMELVPYADGKTSAIRWTSCVPAKALKALLPKTARDIKRAPLVQMAPSCFDGKAFESYAKYLTVCAAGGIATLQTLPAEEFPTLPSMENASEPVVWAGEAFRDLAEKVFPAISTEESRFQLSAARFELNGSARAIATDGHRLHCVDGELLVGSTEDRPEDWADLVPRELLKQALADYRFKPIGRGKKRYSNAVHMSWSEDHVWLETSGVRYCARLLAGTFPDYERVIKKGAAPCQIETTGADLVSTIAAVEHCTCDRARAVQLELDQELPKFYAANSDTGEARATLNGGTSMSGQLERDPPREPHRPEVATGPTAGYHDQDSDARYRIALEDYAAECETYASDKKLGLLKEKEQHIGLNPDYMTDIGKLFPGALDIGLWNDTSQITLTARNFRSVIMPIRL